MAPHPPDDPATKSNVPNIERAAQEPRAQRLGVLNIYSLENAMKKTGIGLLITINVILRFPDLGALIERYNQF